MPDKTISNHSSEFNKKFSFLEVERFLENKMTEEEVIAFQHKIDQNQKLKKHLENAKNQKYSGNMIFLKAQAQKIEKEIPAENTCSTSSSNLERFWRLLYAKPSVAFALTLLITIGLSLFPVKRLHQNPEKAPITFSTKGSIGFKLLFKDSIREPQKQYNVTPGDTLAFVYRSGKPIYVQVWYRDDGGDLFAYIENSGTSYYMAPATNWTSLAHKVVLDSSWNSESLYLIYSPNEFTSNNIKRLLNSDTLENNFYMNHYKLYNTGNTQN